MTKIRNPLSFHAAIYSIGDAIGWDVCDAIIGKAYNGTRKYSDKETGREIKLGDALLLDRAYSQKFGTPAPIFTAYDAQLNDGGDCAPLSTQILILAATASRESGEAIAAAMLAGMDKRQRKIACDEIGEAIIALTTIKQALGGEN